VAVAAGLDIADVRRAMPSPDNWGARAARSWVQWIYVCLYGETQLRNAASGRYYGRPCSPVHSGPYGRVDRQKVVQFEQELRHMSALDDEAFTRSYSRLKQRVNRMMANGTHDRVFKGKWYCAFLAEDANRIGAHRRINRTGLHERLLAALAQSLDFHAPWAMRLRTPIRELLTGEPSSDAG
jgi:hypothetical protein